MWLLGAFGRLALLTSKLAWLGAFYVWWRTHEWWDMTGPHDGGES